MKNKLKGKMVKTKRERVNTEQVICECSSCGWEGLLELVEHNKDGQNLCPNCRDFVLVYEN